MQSRKSLQEVSGHQNQSELPLTDIVNEWAREKGVELFLIEGCIFQYIIQQPSFRETVRYPYCPLHPNHCETLFLPQKANDDTPAIFYVPTIPCFYEQIHFEATQTLLSNPETFSTIPIIIPRERFFAWLRWKYGTQELEKLKGVPKFWGDPWCEYPIFQNLEYNSGEYSISEGFYRQIIPEDWYEFCVMHGYDPSKHSLQQHMDKVSKILSEAIEFRISHKRPFIESSESILDFEAEQNIKNNKNTHILACHNLLIKFIHHFKEGRLEMIYALRGGKKGFIHPDDIEIMVSLGRINFLNSIGVLHGEECLGIRVRQKSDKRS